MSAKADRIAAELAQRLIESEAKVARVEALADRLWAEVGPQRDGRDIVGIVYRHVIGQFRGALAGDSE